MPKIAFITGASAGIGAATASILAQNGYNLLLAARRLDRLETLATELQAQYGVRVHTFALDVRNRAEVSAQLNALPAEWQNIHVLVNNAGLSQGLDAFHEANLDDWDTMIDTNVKGLLYVSRLVSEWMVARKTGHIINIGSIAGKEIYANGNLYGHKK